MLEAVAASPVRRNVKPEGLPEQATPELQRSAQQQAGRIPALASLLGLAIPPPPGPRRRLDAAGRPVPAPPVAGEAAPVARADPGAAGEVPAAAREAPGPEGPAPEGEAAEAAAAEVAADEGQASTLF
jgi:hypothetical protein